MAHIQGHLQAGVGQGGCFSGSGALSQPLPPDGQKQEAGIGDPNGLIFVGSGKRMWG